MPFVAFCLRFPTWMECIRYVHALSDSPVDSGTGAILGEKDLIYVYLSLFSLSFFSRPCCHYLISFPPYDPSPIPYQPLPLPSAFFLRVYPVPKHGITRHTRSRTEQRTPHRQGIYMKDRRYPRRQQETGKPNRPMTAAATDDPNHQGL